MNQLDCGACMRCEACAAYISHELHSMLAHWDPCMGPDYARLSEELEAIESYLDRMERDSQDDWQRYELENPYEARGLSKDDFL